VWSKDPNRHDLLRAHGKICAARRPQRADHRFKCGPQHLSGMEPGTGGAASPLVMNLNLR
jgi:hypothetical protein